MTRPDTNIVVPTYTDEEVHAILSGHEEAMRLHDEEMQKLAPKCHFRPMVREGDYCDGFWWECTVCGHTK